jgi:hypothetical protein
MTSRGEKLVVIKDYDTMTLLKKTITVFCFIVLFLFFSGSLSHKMIGVEILHTFQLIFLLQALDNNVTPVFKLLNYFSIVSGNFLFLKNTRTNIYISKYDYLYNPSNQDFSEGLIIGISFFFFLLFLLPLLRKYKINLKKS